jgi:hypothetical protein
MPRPPLPRCLVVSTVPGFPAWRPLACLAVLALAPGCSGSAGAEDKDELVPFVDRRGITSYRYVPKKPPAPPQPAQETRKGPDFVEWQQQLALEKQRRQEEVRAHEESQRERAEAWRLEQQEIQAHQDALRRNQLAELRQQRWADQPQSSWAWDQAQRYQAEAAQFQRASEELDQLLRCLRR